MKVLVLECSIYPTGALRSILGMAEALREQGFAFHFAMDGDTTAADCVRQKGFDVHHLRMASLSKRLSGLLYPFKLVRDSFRVWRLFRSVRADILHVNDIYLLAGVSVSFIRDVRLVQHCRLLRSSYIGLAYSFFSGLVCARAKRVIAVSEAVRADLGDHQNVRVIFDAIDGAETPPEKVYRDHSQDCRFLYVGNFVRGKGHDLAIAAFSRVVERYPLFRMNMVGVGANGELDPGFVRSLRESIAQKDLSDRVLLLPAVAEIESAMKSADVVVNLSESESFSMVCLEALTYGVPLVASDCGGPREILGDGRFGLLVRNRDPGDAAEAMLKLATNPAWAEDMGRRGAAHARESFNMIVSSRKLANLYDEVMRS